MNMASKDINILFVGNSLTYWNNGVDYHFEQLANAGNSDWKVTTASVVESGVSLKYLWQFTAARKTIRAGGIDVVVIQDDLPETTVASFKKHAALFYRECQKAGARLVLYMTWPYDRLDWISLEEIHQVHLDVSSELGADLAPVGVLMDRVRAVRPDLEMLDKDREHPSICGTYLAAAALYGVIFKADPEPCSYVPDKGGITDADAEFLRRLAWNELD